MNTLLNRLSAPKDNARDSNKYDRDREANL